MATADPQLCWSSPTTELFELTNAKRCLQTVADLQSFWSFPNSSLFELTDSSRR